MAKERACSQSAWSGAGPAVGFEREDSLTLRALIHYNRGMDAVSTTTKIAALALTAVILSGCSTGVRLQDEQKSKVMAATKESYINAKVLDIFEVENKNLASLLAEELKVVRDNNKLQIDLALLEIADNGTPMADTYAGEAKDRLEQLGYLSHKHLRDVFLNQSGGQVRNPRLADRSRRIKKVAGVLPLDCQLKVDLAPNMQWPDELSEQKLSIAKTNYQAYRVACEKRKDELASTRVPEGKTKKALDDWKTAKSELNSREEDVLQYKAKVTQHRKEYNDALALLNIVEGNGGKLETERRKQAETALQELDEAKALLNKTDASALAGENVNNIITLLTAVSGREIDTKNTNVKKAAEIMAEIPSLAGDMKALMEQGRAPSVSNLLIEMRHQVLRMEYAVELRTLAEERVAILKTVYDGYWEEAKLWLEFSNALCSFAVVSAGKEFPGQACDEFTVSVAHGEVECKFGAEPLADCILAKPWNENISNPANGTATREIYKALSAYLRALGSQSQQHEQTYNLINIRHRETLAAKEAAIRSWNNLVETPITQLDAYYASGIKASEIADLFVKALGLTAIAIGVSH